MLVERYLDALAHVVVLVVVVDEPDDVEALGDLDGVLPAGIRKGEGMLAALEDLLAHYRSPSIEGLPPLHGGLMGYLGYDVVREVEHLPNVPPDDRGFPDGIMSVIGELVAIDHWRQRAVLLANVVVPESTGDPVVDEAALDAAYDEANKETLDKLKEIIAQVAAKNENDHPEDYIETDD